MVKKDKAKKLKKPRVSKLRKRMTGLVILDGKRQIDRRTGLNRDIPPMGGGGGSPNLMQALALRPPITGQGGFTIQTPDQFKQAQDISAIAEEVKKQGRINIGEPTKLTGKVIDLTDVEEQKKTFVKPEPVKMQTPIKQEPFGKNMSQYEEMLVKQARLAKAEDEARRTMRTTQSAPATPADLMQEGWFGARSAGGAVGGPRNWSGGGHVAGLSSASAPTSLVGLDDATGAPQPDV